MKPFNETLVSYRYEHIIRVFNARQPPDARSIMQIEAARGVPYAERRSGVLTRLRLYRDGDGVSDGKRPV